MTAALPGITLRQDRSGARRGAVFPGALLVTEENLSKKLPSKLPLKAHLATPKPVLDEGLPGCLVSIIVFLKSQRKIGDLSTWKGEVATVGNKCVGLKVMKRDMAPSDMYSPSPESKPLCISYFE